MWEEKGAFDRAGVMLEDDAKRGKVACEDDAAHGGRGVEAGVEASVASMLMLESPVWWREYCSITTTTGCHPSQKFTGLKVHSSAISQ
jgi:hypothetical protein